MPHKIISTEEAASLVKNGDTIAMNPRAEEFLVGLEKRFLATKSPKNLNVIAMALMSNFAERGFHHLVHDGMLKRIISGHISMAPKIVQLILDNKIEAYIYPMGQLIRLNREAAAGKKARISKIGLHTYVDPRLGGAKQNELTRKKGEDLIDLINFKGEEYLYYKTIPIDVCVVKSYIVDEIGNVSYARDIGQGRSELYMAMATKRNGGKVIAEARWIAKEGSIPPKEVTIPHVLVDAVLVEEEENRWDKISNKMGLTYLERYLPALAGEIKIPLDEFKPIPLDINKIIARRAAFELVPGTKVNFGFGIPGYIMYLAKIDEGMEGMFTQTIEFGMVGGVVYLLGFVPFVGDIPFGPVLNPDAILDISNMFDFIEGGGLDDAFLSFTQLDEKGNANVSRFGPFIVGPGGYVDISQSTPNIYFCGTFTVGLSDVGISPKGLDIKKDGQIKFVKDVEQITFSGKMARDTLGKKYKKIMVITERAVFDYTKNGLVLIESAPGVDVKKDILEKMEFKPKVARDLKTMDSRIFRPKPMGIKKEILAKKK